jgi:hypothetical protein
MTEGSVFILARSATPVARSAPLPTLYPNPAAAQVSPRLTANSTGSGVLSQVLHYKCYFVVVISKVAKAAAAPSSANQPWPPPMRGWSFENIMARILSLICQVVKGLGLH